MFLRTLLLSLILYLHYSDAWGQGTSNYNKIDRWALSQKLRDTALVEFTHHLVHPAQDDFEKIRAIFQFVIHFLDYDHTTSPSASGRINQNIYDVLKRKKGICVDYAQLFCKMADIAGLECQIVSGFSKDLGHQQPVHPEPDHAWNMVKIDSGFYLLDPTWASNTREAKDKFQNSYGTDYFLTPPNLFIKNHFPGLAMFQLLSCPVTFADFAASSMDTVDIEACDFHFQDSIYLFDQLSPLDQKIKAQLSVYQYLENSQNQSAWAHALLDKAVDLKERADLFYQENQLALAISHYQDAIDVFNLAGQNTTLYRWQIESRGFCHLNYSQVLYKSQKNTGNDNAVITHLSEAKKHLLTLNSSSPMIIQALGQIEANLAHLK